MVEQAYMEKLILLGSIFHFEDEFYCSLVEFSMWVGWGMRRLSIYLEKLVVIYVLVLVGRSMLTLNNNIVSLKERYLNLFEQKVVGFFFKDFTVGTFHTKGWTKLLFFYFLTFVFFKILTYTTQNFG